MILASKENEDRYHEHTHSEGFLRRFFNPINSVAGSSLGRVFVTG